MVSILILTALAALVIFGGMWVDHYYPTTINSATTDSGSFNEVLGWFSWLGNAYGGIPIWIYILGAAAIWFALKRINFGSVSVSLPSTGSVLAQILISFTVLATFFYLLSKIYPNAPLFQPGEGYGHIALYFLLSGLIALVAVNFKGKAWFVQTALVVVMFAMIGHRTADLLDPSGKLSARIASILSFGDGGSTQVASSITAPGCPNVGKQLAWTFSSTPQRINANAMCNVQFYLHGNCIMVRRAAKTGDSTPYKACTGQFPNDIEWAWTASTPFTGEVDYSALPYRS